MHREFATPDPACFCRKPAPRSQGCEGARVLTGLDTGTENKFPVVVYGKASPDVKISPGTALSRYAQDLYMLDSKRVRAQEIHASFGAASAAISQTQVGRSTGARGQQHELS